MSPERAWGQAFETPDGLVLRAGEPEITDSYTYENFSGEEEVAEPDAGNVFVFIDLDVENPTNETWQSPNRLSFELIAGNQLYEPIGRVEYEREDGYDGLNDLPSGTKEEGTLPYEVPESTELRLFHSDIADGFNEYEVEWSDG